MIEWWTAQQGNMIGAIGGSAIGILGGLIGAAGGILAPRGIGKLLIVGTMLVVTALGVAVLGAGIVALVESQPYHVYYPLLLCGGIPALVFGSLIPVVLMAYRRAELNRLAAEELRCN
jgi:hypothetical protein